MPAEFQKPERRELKDSSKEEESRQQPVWHVLVLNVFTGLAYSLYWAFRTWSQLSAYASQKLESAENLSGSDFALSRFKDISPLLRVIGAVVPVLQVFLFFKFFEGIASLYPKENSFVRGKSKLAAGILTVALTGCIMLAGLQGAWYLLYMLGAIPLAISQYWLNKYWQSQEPTGLNIRQAFNVGELITLVLGASWFGLVVVGFSIHPKEEPVTTAIGTMAGTAGSAIVDRWSKL